MFKEIFILLCCLSLHATNNDQPPKKLSTTQKVLIGAAGTAAAGVAIIVGPAVLPVGTITAIKATVAAATAKAAAAGTAIKATAVAAAPVATGISMGLSGAQAVRPYIFPTTQEELNSKKQQDASEIMRTRTKLRSCIIRNKSDQAILNIPSTCEEVALMFAILEGQEAVDELIRDCNK